MFRQQFVQQSGQSATTHKFEHLHKLLITTVSSILLVQCQPARSQGNVAECGIDVSFEMIRRWVGKFGLQFARNLRRWQARPADVWHRDEVVIKIVGRNYWLWRAADRYGFVLEESSVAA
jgi:hypothetical protein